MHVSLAVFETDYFSLTCSLSFSSSLLTLTVSRWRTLWAQETGARGHYSETTNNSHRDKDSFVTAYLRGDKSCVALCVKMSPLPDFHYLTPREQRVTLGAGLPGQKIRRIFGLTHNLHWCFSSGSLSCEWIVLRVRVLLSKQIPFTELLSYSHMSAEGDFWSHFVLRAEMPCSWIALFCCLPSLEKSFVGS